jgi:hypothetical protein
MIENNSLFRKSKKIFLVNLLLIAGGLVLAELAFGRWFTSPRMTAYQTCYNPITYHHYCPGITAVRTMDIQDGGEVILNHVNLSGLRVASEAATNSHTEVSKYPVINIGDSFLQADEVPFDKTISWAMEKTVGLPVLQVGYSNWAPINYFNWLDTNELHKGVIVNVFLTNNDYVPFNHRSNLKWYKFPHEIRDGKVRFKVKKNKRPSSLFLWIAERSKFIEIYERVKLAFRDKNAIPLFKVRDEWKNYKVLDAVIPTVIGDCAKLSMFDGISPGALDLAMFSFSSDCWPGRFVEELGSAIRDLNRISELVAGKGGRLNVIIVPNGMVLPNEGTIGRQHPYWAISHGTAMTTEGLTPYLKKRIKGNVFNAEALFRKIDTPEPNSLFFSVDGHFNSRAQEGLGKWAGEIVTKQLKGIR